MKKGLWSVKIIFRYALLQLPVIAVLILLLLIIPGNNGNSDRIIWAVLIIWVAKDIILYPFVWRAYESEPQHKNDSMIGLRGVAQERLDFSGFIKVRGEIWFAEVEGKRRIIQKDEPVEIIGIEGLKLIVKFFAKDA